MKKMTLNELNIRLHAMTVFRNLLSDPVLRQAAEGVTGALLRRRGEETELAVPFDPGAPFPLVPLICLGRPATVGGRRYLIFRLDAGGRPRPL